MFDNMIKRDPNLKVGCLAAWLAVTKVVLPHPRGAVHATKDMH